MRPSTHGPDGGDRGPRGRFLPGNRFGGGNPFAGQAAKLRAELFKAITPTKLRKIVKQLVAKAEAGDVVCAKVILERVLGPPIGLDVLERIERLEETLNDEGHGV